MKYKVRASRRKINKKTSCFGFYLSIITPKRQDDKNFYGYFFTKRQIICGFFKKRIIIWYFLPRHVYKMKIVKGTHFQNGLGEKVPETYS